jgi:hypothetical protein
MSRKQPRTPHGDQAEFLGETSEEGLGSKLYTALLRTHPVHRCFSLAQNWQGNFADATASLDLQPRQANYYAAACLRWPALAGFVGTRLPTTWGPALARFVGTRLPAPSH